MVGAIYDGTNFVLIEKEPATTTYYGVTKLSSATNSTSEVLAATPKAVKTTYDVANANKTKLDKISTETWTFTLDGGSTVTKKIAIWTGN